jgi:hypothetical protein
VSSEEITNLHGTIIHPSQNKGKLIAGAAVAASIIGGGLLWGLPRVIRWWRNRKAGGKAAQAPSKKQARLHGRDFVMDGSLRAGRTMS